MAQGSLPSPLIHPRDYHQERWHTQSGAWLREAVFGINDGLVATLGIVAGVTSSHQNQIHVLVAALVAVAAAVVSMALGSYIATRSELDFYASEVERERRELREMPEHEMEEIRQIYTEYGFAPDEIAMLQRRFAQNPDLWLEFMLRDELGILRERLESPVRNALTMGGAVLVGSMPPVLPYLFTPHTGVALRAAVGLSAAAAFALGVVKAQVAKGVWWRSGLTFVAVAGVAAAAGMGLGSLLPRLLGVGA